MFSPSREAKLAESARIERVQLAQTGSASYVRTRLGLYRWAALKLRLLPFPALLVLIAWVTFATPYTTHYDGPPIRSDGVGYHAWTRALLSGDYSFCQWRGAIENFVSSYDKQRKFCQNKYPPGLALLRLPVMAFLVDSTGDSRRIGASEHLASLVIGGAFLGLQCWLLFRVAALLRLRFWRSAAAITLTLVGTGLLHYATYDSAFTHAYSAFFCSVLVYLGVREYATARPMPVALLALAAFFILALRMTNVFLLAIITLAYVVWRPLKDARALWRSLASVTFGAALAIGLQLAYNYLANGTLSPNSYGEEGFVWDRPMQRSVLFSYERGLFTYFPLFGVAILSGCYVRATRKLSLLLVGVVAAYTALYGFWHSWMLGDGMGHRGFVELGPIVAVVLCCAWQRLHGKQLAVALCAGTLATAVTLQLMLGYWDTSYPTLGATREDYWQQLRKLPSPWSHEPNG